MALPKYFKNSLQLGTNVTLRLLAEKALALA